MLERCAIEYRKRFAYPEPGEVATYVDRFAREVTIDNAAWAALKAIRVGLLGCLNILDNWTPRPVTQLQQRQRAAWEEAIRTSPTLPRAPEDQHTVQDLFGRYARHVFFLEDEIRRLASWFVKLEKSANSDEDWGKSGNSHELYPPHTLSDDEVFAAPPLTRRKIVSILFAFHDLDAKVPSPGIPTARQLALASILAGEEIPAPTRRVCTVAAAIKREATTMRAVMKSVERLIPREFMSLGPILAGDDEIRRALQSGKG